MGVAAAGVRAALPLAMLVPVERSGGVAGYNIHKTSPGFKGIAGTRTAFTGHVEFIRSEFIVAARWIVAGVRVKEVAQEPVHVVAVGLVVELDVAAVTVRVPHSHSVFEVYNTRTL